MSFEKPKLKHLSPIEVAEAQIRFAFSNFPELQGPENHERIKQYAKTAVEALAPLRLVDPNAKAKEGRLVFILSNFGNGDDDAVYVTVLDAHGERITPKAMQISGFIESAEDKKLEQRNHRKLNTLIKGKPLPMCVWSNHRTMDSDKCTAILFESFSEVNNETPYSNKTISISYSDPEKILYHGQHAASLTLTLKIPVGRFLPMFVLADLSYSSALVWKMNYRPDTYDQSEYSLRDYDLKGWPRSAKTLNLLKNFSTDRPVLFNILDDFTKYRFDEVLSNPELFGTEIRGYVRKPSEISPFISANVLANHNEGLLIGVEECGKLPGGDFIVNCDRGLLTSRPVVIRREDKCGSSIEYLRQFYKHCHGADLEG